MSTYRDIAEVNAQGRVTLPAAIRRALGLDVGSHVELELHDGEVTLRPAVVIPAEDAWAYTSEHIERVRKALAEVEAGEVFQFSRDDLLHPGS